MSSKLAVATLLYSTDYLPGVFTLGYQLKKLLQGEESITTCLLISRDLYSYSISDLSKSLLGKLYEKIIEIDPLNEQEECMRNNAANLDLLKRPELSFTMIKARLWELIEFDRVLYLDGDTLPLNKDFLKLFDMIPEQKSSQIGGAPDIGWPDMFNSGVLMLVPDADMASQLQKFLLDHVSIDGADQGILNQFFNPNCNLDTSTIEKSLSNEWIRLPFIYNVTMPNYGYQCSPAIKYFESQVKLVHFIGENKPWKGWSYDNVNGYTTRWNDTYLQFQAEYGLRGYFRDLSLQDKSRGPLWEKKQDQVLIHYSSKPNTSKVAPVHNWTNFAEKNTNELPERIFPKKPEQPRSHLPFSIREEAEESKASVPQTPDEPQRVFPTELEKESCAAVEPSQEPERVFPKEPNGSKCTLEEASDEPERVFPKEEDVLGHTQSNPEALGNEAPSKLDGSSETETPTDQKLLIPVKEDVPKFKPPPHIFDWEDTNYLKEVERSFPDDL